MGGYEGWIYLILYRIRGAVLPSPVLDLRGGSTLSGIGSEGQIYLIRYKIRGVPRGRSNRIRYWI